MNVSAEQSSLGLCCLPDNLANTPETLERFRREAQSARWEWLESAGERLTGVPSPHLTPKGDISGWSENQRTSLTVPRNGARLRPGRSMEALLGP